VDEADDPVPGEDDVGVDVPGCAALFGGEVDREAGCVVEDVEEGGLGGGEAAPGVGYLEGGGGRCCVGGEGGAVWDEV
jgi:hypothetical protein